MYTSYFVVVIVFILFFLQFKIVIFMGKTKKETATFVSTFILLDSCIFDISCTGNYFTFLEKLSQGPPSSFHPWTPLQLGERLLLLDSVILHAFLKLRISSDSSTSGTFLKGDV